MKGAKTAWIRVGMLEDGAEVPLHDPLDITFEEPDKYDLMQYGWKKVVVIPVDDD